MAGYENRIVAFSGSALEGSVFKSQLRDILRSYPRCRGVEQRYIVSSPKH